MDLWKTILVLLRRWYVAVPVFVVSLGLAGAAFAAVPLRWESSGTVVLTTPASGASSEAAKQRGLTNPFLAFDMSLGVTAAILIQNMKSPSVQESLGVDGKDSTYEVTGPEIGTPFIHIVAESTTKQGASEIVKRALERVNKDLIDRQTALQAPPSTFIRIEAVAPPTEAEPLRGGKLRAMGAALVLGFAAMLTGAYGLESWSLARKRKLEAEERKTHPAPTSNTPPPPPAVQKNWSEPTMRMEPAKTGSKPAR
jgi:hypothetical protein